MDEPLHPIETALDDSAGFIRWLSSQGERKFNACSGAECFIASYLTSLAIPFSYVSFDDVETQAANYPIPEWLVYAVREAAENSRGLVSAADFLNRIASPIEAT